MSQPKLRFPEFSREWEEISIENSMEKIIDYRGKTPDKTDSGIPLITAKIIKHGKINNATEFISENDYETWMSRGLPKSGDVLITSEAPLGEVAQINESKIALAQRIITLRGKKGLVHNVFLFHVLTSPPVQYKIKIKSTGSTVHGIKQKELRKVLLEIPTFPEQEKIASFLSQVDKKIDLLETKQELWETYKKGIMQQIFSQKLRFKDENGEDYPDWEEKRLGEIMIEGKLGGNYENSESNNGPPLIKMGNIGRGSINLDKVQYLPEGNTYDKNDILIEGDLLFNTRNTLDLVGKVALWRNEIPFALYNSNLMRMKFRECIESSNRFMNYLFNTRQSINLLRSYATGTTSVAAIYGRDLKRLKVKFPSLPEQRKIASFLSTIDNKIEEICNELKINKEFKKGLLQQMFC